MPQQSATTIRFCIIIVFTFCFFGFSFAQISNERVKIFAASADSFQIDTFSIIPHSIQVVEWPSGNIVSDSLYAADYFHSYFLLKRKINSDSLKISYRVFPIAFTKTFEHKNFEALNKQDSILHHEIIYTPQELNQSALDLGNMDYNGNFARGISFGNNQDLVLNSSFNLQLQGKLAGDVDVSAALSDNNIPIQPEGNTQQIQDFDKIFIQLKRKQTALTVGDYELQRPGSSYFMNFSKKLQGGNVSSISDLGNDWKLKSNVSGAVAKGKYVRNEFIGQEGNQGPYRLTGPNGETYIIVLAGSERVYIDGELMRRGSDGDYIIDYNAGEVTFTTNRLITKDKRISVEYEYSDKNYFRSLLFTGFELQHKNLSLHINGYTEQDAKNQPLLQTINDTDRLILENAGDNLQLAVVPGADSVAFSADRILYKNIDSVVNLSSYNIYVYSTNPDSAKYAVSFSFTGTNKGNYIISNSIANGRVYAWVAPVAGIPQGSYEPVIPLVPPQKSQQLTIGTDYAVNKNISLSWEGTVSNHDVNTFSSIGNNDDAGLATHIAYNQKIPLNNDPKKLTQLTLGGQYEFAVKNFSAVERYRPVEFVRDWNLSTDTVKANENIGSFQSKLSSASSLVQYTATLFNRQSDYNGLNQSLTGSSGYKGFHVTAGASYLTSKSSLLNTEFFRPSFDISQAIGFLNGVVAGINGEEENNRINAIAGDSLSGGSFLWNQGGFYLKSNDTFKIKFALEGNSRVDFLPKNNTFEKITTGNTINFSSSLNKNPNNRLDWNITYRKLNVEDTSLTTQQPDESVLSRINYDGNIKKGFVNMNALYELGSVQQQKLEYAYAPVPDGTGIYTWIDYNADSIQQLNEFVVAAFQSDADYIKILLPTTEYVKAYSSLFNESITINPQSLWKTENGLKGFIARFSAQSSLQIDKKTLAGDFSTRFNPFLLNVNDSILVSADALISNYLFFNKTDPKFGMDISMQNNHNKSILTNGAEQRTLEDYSFRWRWNFSKKFSTIVKLNTNQKGLEAQYLPQSNYSILSYKAEPQLTWQPSSNFRLASTYSFIKSKNQIDSMENAITHGATVELRYNVVSKSTIDMSASYVNIRYNGANSSPVQYVMLDGLQNGQNFLLHIEYDRKISNLVDMLISYDGRKTGEAHIVHTGNVQIRALF